MKMTTIKIKVLGIVAVCCIAQLAATAQVNMRDVLCQMPDTVVPYLSRNNLLDLADFVESGMKAEVTNTLEGKTVLDTLSSDYAKLTLNNATTIEMRLLPYTPEHDNSGSPVDTAHQTLCVVRTFGNSVRESVIDFYTPQWSPLPALNRIGMEKGWGTVGHDTNIYHAMLGQQDQTLTLIADNQLDVPANSEQKKAEKSSIVLKWDGRKFKKY